MSTPIYVKKVLNKIKTNEDVLTLINDIDVYV